MDEEFLRKLYLDYYKIGNVLNFRLDTDVEHIQFLTNYKNVKGQNLKQTLKNFKRLFREKILNNILNNSKDDYFADKSIVHITYPIEQTISRLDIIYNSIKYEEWYEIFGFDYKNMIALICMVILRTNTCNNLLSSNIENVYDFYLTKDEFYKYLKISTKEIDKILKFISIDLKEIGVERDCFNIIRFDENKYTLIFIWDFLYYLYDKIETKIKEKYNEEQLDNYYRMRGKTFEKQCVKEIDLHFKDKEIYNNVYYLNGNSKNELDVVLMIKNKIIVFECKTTQFDIYRTNNNEELECQIIRALGNGYKTINNFNEYIRDKENIQLFDKNNRIEINIKGKEIIYVCVSINNIEFVQSSIQKIEGKVLKKVNKYPIVLNYLDFLSILELSSLNLNLILKYLSERFFTINELKMLSLDIDEMDALGFLTDAQNEKLYNMIKESASKNIDTNIKITNGIYRKQVNELLNEKFLNKLYTKH